MRRQGSEQVGQTGRDAMSHDVHVPKTDEPRRSAPTDLQRKQILVRDSIPKKQRVEMGYERGTLSVGTALTAARSERFTATQQSL